MKCEYLVSACVVWGELELSILLFDLSVQDLSWRSFKNHIHVIVATRHHLQGHMVLKSVFFFLIMSPTFSFVSSLHIYLFCVYG